MATKNAKQILETLTKLGGREASEDSLTFEGEKLIIPARWSSTKAIAVIRQHEEAEAAEHNFDRQFRYRPWDVAAAAMRSIKVLTGTSGIGVATRTFFGRTPPSMVTVDIGVNETLQIPWGLIEVPLFEGTVMLTSQGHPDYGTLGFIRVTAPRKMRSAIEGWFKMIENELATASIYRGKAFNGAEEPEFIDLDTVDPAQVIYTSEVEFQLEANVWSAIRYTQALRDQRIPLKRSCLLYGDFGTGKTLAAFLTARIAVENNWTFIYCRPAKDDLHSVMQTAKLYQPSVVFFEDVDVVSESGEVDEVTRLLDTFDGITAKGTELIAMLTTNHPERIHKGMIRPGRLDSVIEMGALDPGSFQRMIESSVSADSLAVGIDYAKIGEAMEGLLPAFVKEVIERTKMYAMARNEGKLTVLDTDDFVHAALGIRPQLEMMSDATEGKKRPELDKVFSNVVRQSMDQSQFIDNYDDPIGKLVTTNGN